LIVYQADLTARGGDVHNVTRVRRHLSKTLNAKKLSGLEIARITIRQELDEISKFQLFRPVLYREKRPPLYDDTLNFIADSLFGDQEARRRAMLEKIVYAKTLPWQHEGEYRLAIPMRQGEPPWNILPFHPEEITEALPRLRDGRQGQGVHCRQSKAPQSEHRRLPSKA
jgi:hypothetical protein